MQSTKQPDNKTTRQQDNQTTKQPDNKPLKSSSHPKNIRITRCQ